MEEENKPQPQSESVEPKKRSKSRTTNIPPIMPEGYAYEPDPQQPLRSSTDPLAPTPSASEPQPERSKRFTHPEGQRTHTHSVNIPFRQIGKWVGIVAIVLIVAGAIGLGIDRWMHRPAEPTEAVPIAADSDSMATPVATPDTAALNRLREDSLRREDSIRHAKWIYWQRRKQAEQAAQQKAQQEEEATTSTTEHTDTAAH